MADLDPMDARLREYADRWRDVAPTTPAVPIDRLTSRQRPGRAWWLIAASAATVAAVIVGATQLVGDEGPRKPPPPTHTVKPTDAVPWAPLPPTHPEIPTTTTPASPDPAAAVGKPACRAADLHATSERGAAAGTYYLTIRLALIGDHPCRLQGYPPVRLLDQGRPAAIPVQHRVDDSAYFSAVLVAEGRPALVRLSWPANWCAAPVHNDTVELVLPGGLLTLPGLGGSQCYGTPGSGHRQPVEVGTFEPAKTSDAAPTTAYAAVDVSAALDMTATTDAALDFVVTLTSPHDLALDPCPDYRIVLSGGAAPETESHALNCAAVPYHDGQGRPYLPAGTPVRFAMHAASGEPGTYKLSWVLDTVDQRGASGTLTVAAPGGASSSPLSRDDALRLALAADPAVRAEVLGGLQPQGPVVCGIHVMGTGADGRTFYLWLSCSDYVVTDGVAVEQTGSHEPAVVQVRGQGADLVVEKVTFPRQQSLEADIKRMFPPSIAAHIYDESSTRTSPSGNELKAEAVRDAVG